MKIIKSKIVPFKRNDVDTDLIIPAEFLTVVTKQGLGKNLFARLREADANFPLNLLKYHGAQILVVGKNFGCGSSREHASWALAGWGISVVIAKSFADIFYSNALKNGILPVVLDEKIVDEVFEQDSKSEVYEIEVNLEDQKVTLPDRRVFSFSLDPYRKECLMKGIDDMEYLLSNLSGIEKFDQNHAKNIFFDISVL